MCATSFTSLVLDEIIGEDKTPWACFVCCIVAGSRLSIRYFFCIGGLPYVLHVLCSRLFFFTRIRLWRGVDMYAGSAGGKNCRRQW